MGTTPTILFALLQVDEPKPTVWWAGWEDGEWEGDGLYTALGHAKAISVEHYLDAEVLPLNDAADFEDEDEAEVRQRRQDVAVNLLWKASGNDCWRLVDTVHGWTGVALYRWEIDNTPFPSPPALVPTDDDEPTPA